MHTPSEGQELAINYAIDKKYSMIAMPPGQGKTLVGVEIAKRLNLKMLVVCPTYARKVWIKEIKNQWPDCEHITEIVEGKQIYPVWHDGATIVSYSLLNERGASKKGREATDRIDPLFEWADIVIFDEFHLIKETDTSISHACHKLIYENRLPYVVMLSGTQAKNRVHELYSGISLAQYKYDEETVFLRKFPSWVHFANRFSYKRYGVIKTRRGNRPTIVYYGIRNKEELKTILEKCYFKLPDKYLHKLPPRVVNWVDFDGTFPSNFKEDALLEEFEEMVKSGKEANAKIKAQAAEVTSLFSARLAIDLQQTHGPVVIFTDHVKSSQIIAEKISKATGQLIEPINGLTPKKKREAIKEEFDEGGVDYIVATTGTLSMAISLTRSSCMILNDPPYVPGDLDQVEKRIQRRGQDKTCFYYRVLATSKTQRIYDILKDKAETLAEIDNLMEPGDG